MQVGNRGCVTALKFLNKWHYSLGVACSAFGVRIGQMGCIVYRDTSTANKGTRTYEEKFATAVWVHKWKRPVVETRIYIYHCYFALEQLTEIVLDWIRDGNTRNITSK